MNRDAIPNRPDARARPYRAQWFRLAALAPLAALALGGCAAQKRPDARSSPGNAAGALSRSESAETAALRRVLERAITDRSGWESLRLLAECRGDWALSSARVFGNGIGIWNEERQFRLEPDHIADLLGALRDADFPGFEDVYGGPPRASRKPPAGTEEMVTMITCRVELVLGGHEKQVTQLDKGEQSPVLKKLAEDLLKICESSARSGVGASSLRDGLEKIARGVLAPESWVIMLHRRPGAGRDPASPSGFMLGISGSQATARAYEPEAGYAPQIALRLSPDELRTLAHQLATHDPAVWPVNLYARDYTDLSIRVLNHERSIQARQFAGVGPATHGEQQKAFEEVFKILDRIHHRVLEHGRHVP